MSFLCPVCKSELMWGGRARYQTLDEHVTMPNAESPVRGFYYCDNACCDANSPQDCRYREVLTEKSKKTEPDSIGVFWDEHGDLYGNPYGIKFIGDNDAPFGSDGRRLRIEIHKKDENFRLLELFGYRLNVEFRYKADNDGNVTQRRFDITIWKRDGRLGGYVSVVPAWRMLAFCNRMFKRNLSNFRKNQSAYSGRELKELFYPRFDRRAYSRLFAAYVSLFYPRLKKMLKNHPGKWDY